MACACGGANKKTSDYEVTVNGSVAFRAQTQPEAKIWIMKNAKGKAATIRAVPKATAS
jgi:hypothetical protein